ncbi:MAG: hypothetical protein AAGC97_06960 [Planctomycetota bacterium]
MNPLNPYAPVAEVSTTPVELASPDAEPRSPARTIGRWTLVCVLAAAPSFVIGFMVTSGQWLGMLAGVVFFIIAYSWADIATASTWWRQRKLIRRTLVTTYSLRILMTLVFPVGGYIDMMVGVASMVTVGAVTGTSPEGDQFGFWLAFATAIVQGLLLNLMLLVFAIVILPIIAGIMRLRRGPADPPVTGVELAQSSLAGDASKSLSDESSSR